MCDGSPWALAHHQTTSAPPPWIPSPWLSTTVTVSIAITVATTLASSSTIAIAASTTSAAVAVSALAATATLAASTTSFAAATLSTASAVACRAAEVGNECVGDGQALAQPRLRLPARIHALYAV